MHRAQIVIPGNPGTVLARVAPALAEWLGPEGYVLGGGTVLAARWQHRVSTDIDLFTDLVRYQSAIVSQRERVAEILRSLGASPSGDAIENAPHSPTGGGNLTQLSTSALSRYLAGAPTAKEPWKSSEAGCACSSPKRQWR